MKKPLAFLLLFLFSFIYSKGQSPSDLLTAFNQKFPQEKIHLHFDKDQYIAGESVWFKAYLMAADLPDTISTSVTVEMADAAGKVLSRKNLPVFDGTANGNFEIPDTLAGGTYLFRAYTAWMLNFDPGFVITRPILIFNTGITAQIDSSSNNFSFDFFPEGGVMIADVVNFVAFKATDGNGNPISFTGSLFDSKENSIAEIKPVHDGMGKFTLLPASGEKYSALIKFENGKIITVQLPHTEAGIAMHVENDTKDLRISLSRSNPSGGSEAFFVLGQMGNRPVFEFNAIIKKESVSVIQPVDNLPSGILQVTLFDSVKRPLAERLTFINSGEYDNQPFIGEAGFNVNRRAKNEFSFSVPDSIDGSFSLAITDADKTQVEENKRTIISDLLLTADIKGYVHNPAWYFENKDKHAKNALDLVMMTNGWRRFQWTSILTGKLPEIKYTPFPYIRLSGKVYAENRRDLVTDGDLNLFIHDRIDSTTRFYNVPIDSQGNFQLDSLIFKDTANVYFNYNSKRKNKKLVTFKLEQNQPFPLLNSFPSVKISGQFPTGALVKTYTSLSESYKKANSKVITLKEVNIKVRKKSPAQQIVDRYSKLLIPVGGGNTIDLINEPIPGYTPLQNLVTRIPWIEIKGTPANPVLMRTRGGQVNIYLDGIPTDYIMVTYLKASDLALITFNNGALYIYQKKGNDLRGTQASFLSSLNLPGYAVTRQFYSPDYSMPPDDAITDKRTTLYWNPDILTDKDNRTIKLGFYNSDDCHKMRIIIEGFNMAGQLFRAEKIITP